MSVNVFTIFLLTLPNLLFIRLLTIISGVKTMKKLLYEVRDRVAYIVINRPEVMNAMDLEVYEELSRAWIDVRDNPDVWVAVITGAGEKAFTAGADLRSVIPKVPERADFWLTQKNMLLNRGLEVWKPVIAAVNGYCLAGGMTLLFATDIRIAAEHAVFEISEVKRGILPGNGGTQRALRQLPYPIAMEMLLLGRRLTAQEALTYGLINKVVPMADLMSTAEGYARQLCENAPLSLRAIKELAVRSQTLSLEHGLRLEESFLEFLRTTEDAKEGPKAFVEKRKPLYKAR
jgi:E-phenylitaconyl-CoA hydratase